MKRKKIRFIHLLPSDSMGGAECAARSSGNFSDENFLFTILYISKNKNKKNFILNYFTYIYDCFLSIIKIIKQSPDIIIISLWKSCLAAIFVKLLKPKVKIILFLHSSNLNFIDYFFNNIIAIIAYEIWADSTNTLNNRLNSFYFVKKRTNKNVISFVLSHLSTLKLSAINTNFIYWGRLHPIKNIRNSIDIFYSVYKVRNNSKFIIIGPDDGDFLNLKKHIIELKLQNAVKIYSQMSLENIKEIAKNSSFFIQSSLSEGMAMSVLESMQLGLVPIVSNVGNIQNYCKDKFNSLIIDQSIKRKILDISNDKKKYLFLRKNAIRTWESKRLYKEDIYENCLRLSNKLNN